MPLPLHRVPLPLRVSMAPSPSPLGHLMPILPREWIHVPFAPVRGYQDSRPTSAQSADVAAGWRRIHHEERGTLLGVRDRAHAGGGPARRAADQGPAGDELLPGHGEAAHHDLQHEERQHQGVPGQNRPAVPPGDVPRSLVPSLPPKPPSAPKPPACPSLGARPSPNPTLEARRTSRGCPRRPAWSSSGCRTLSRK